MGIAAAVAAGFYRVLGLPLRQPLNLYMSRLTEAGALYLVSLLLIFLFKRLSAIKASSEEKPPLADTVRAFAAERLTFERLIHDFRLLNAVAVMFVVFIQLKHLTPFIRKSLFDEALLLSEQSMFGGELAGALLARSLPTEFAAVLSDAYVLFYPYMAFLILYFILRSKQSGSTFCTAFALCWFLGAALIYLVPSWGPCFYRPELFNHLAPTQMSELQSDLWKNKLFVESNPNSTEGVFLISGFPSLHVAIPLLGTILLYPFSQALALASGALTILTVLSTLYFGWHYVIDDVGAAFLVFLALVLQRVVDHFLQKILGRYPLN